MNWSLLEVSTYFFSCFLFSVFRMKRLTHVCIAAELQKAKDATERLKSQNSKLQRRAARRPAEQVANKEAIVPIVKPKNQYGLQQAMGIETRREMLDMRVRAVPRLVSFH